MFKQVRKPINNYFKPYGLAKKYFITVFFKY